VPNPVAVPVPAPEPQKVNIAIPISKTTTKKVTTQKKEACVCPPLVPPASTATTVITTAGGKRGKRRQLAGKKATVTVLGATPSQGYYYPSAGCQCPCYCSAPTTTIVATQNTGKKGGKRRLQGKKSVTSTIITVPSTYNNQCVCNNVAASSVVYNVAESGGKSKSGGKRRAV